MKIPNVVKRFKDRSAELGEPSKSLLLAKLDNPLLSCGIRRKIVIIKKILVINPITFNILDLSKCL